MTKKASTSSGASKWPGRPLGNQAFLGVAAMLGLVVAFAVLAILLVTRMDRDESGVTSGNVAYLNATQEAALNAKGIANDQRGFLLSGDTSFLAEARQRLTTARAAFATAHASANENAQRGAINAARQGFELWIAAAEVEVNQFQNGDQQSAITQSLTADRELRKDYEAAITKAQQIGASNERTDQSTVARATRQTVVLLIAGLVAALVVGVGIGRWLLRSIAAPLYRIADYLCP